MDMDMVQFVKPINFSRFVVKKTLALNSQHCNRGKCTLLGLGIFIAGDDRIMPLV
jgi:hypothetical protein